MTAFAIVCREREPAQVAHVARQAEALADAGHAVDVFLPAMLAPLPVTHDRVRVRSLGNVPATAGLATVLFWVRVCAILSLALFRNRYHVIQIDGATGLFVFTSWLARRFGTKIVLDVTAAGPERVMAQTGARREDLRVRLAVIVEQFVVDFADYLIVCSDPLRDRYISRGCPPEKISVIYRTPAEQLYGKPLTVTRHPSVTDRFLIVCRETPDQPADCATVIRAVASLRERLPSALLWIVCRPEQREPLERLVRELRLTEHVLIQEPLPEESVPAFLAQADAHVVATPRDALSDLLLPLGIFEGVFVGVPTIAVRTLATQYYFDPHSLPVYDQGDTGELAIRLHGIAEDPQARLAFVQHVRDMRQQVQWSSERHRYVALLLAVAMADLADTDRAPAEAAGFSRLSRRPSASIHTYAAVLAAPRISVPLAGSAIRERDQTLQSLPLRLSAPSQEWRLQRQWRMRLSDWALRIISAALLISIPIAAAHVGPFPKVLTALLFALVVGFLLLMQPGEAAIIVALFFIAQRTLFHHFPPEGQLGPVLAYLGTALQLFIFAGFLVRAIVQQRPLMRSQFVLWPAALFGVVSLISTWVNHVPIGVAALGIEHTLHNLIFVVLIAEDLPTPQQLRRAVGVIIAGLSAMAAISVFQTALVFHWFGAGLTSRLAVFIPPNMPVAVILPDADTYAYLLNFGILLALAVFIARNTARTGYADAEVPVSLNAALIGATLLLTFAQFLTRSTENWIGLVAGVIALAVILRGHLRYVTLGYLAFLLVLGAIAVPAAPGSPAVSTIATVAGIAHGQLPHDAPLSRSIQVITAHPLLGVGPGRFGGTVAFITHSPIYDQYGFSFPGAIASINLFWLHILGETGILGLGAFLWLMVQALIAIWRAFHKGAYREWHGIIAGVFGIVVAMCIATFFGNSLEIDSVSAPFWALVGIAVALPLANRPVITEAMPIIRFRADAHDEKNSIAPAQAPAKPDHSYPGVQEGTGA